MKYNYPEMVVIGCYWDSYNPYKVVYPFFKIQLPRNGRVIYNYTTIQLPRNGRVIYRVIYRNSNNSIPVYDSYKSIIFPYLKSFLTL